MKFIEENQNSQIKVKPYIKFEQDKFQNKFINNFNLRRNINNKIPKSIIDEERKIIYLLQKNCTIFVKYEILKKIARFALFKNGLKSVFI